MENVNTDTRVSRVIEGGTGGGEGKVRVYITRCPFSVIYAFSFPFLLEKE